MRLAAYPKDTLAGRAGASGGAAQTETASPGTVSVSERPERRGQTRIYSVRDRARIILILRGRRLGFSLAEIREYLDLYDRNLSVKQLLHARRKFEERIAAFERQKVDIDTSISEIKRSIAEVDGHLADYARKDAIATPREAIAAE